MKKILSIVAAASLSTTAMANLPQAGTTSTSSTTSVTKPTANGGSVTTITTTTTTTTVSKPTVTTTVSRPTLVASGTNRPTGVNRPTRPTTTVTTVNRPTTTTVTTVNRPTTTTVTTVNRPTANRPTAPATQPTTTQPAQNTAITGVATVAVANAYTPVNSIDFANAIAPISGTHEINRTGDINKLIVGNRTIDLLPQRKNGNGITIARDGENTLNVGHYLTYAKHGNYMIGKNPRTNESGSIVFYQGQATAEKDMPTTGTATYRGIAVQSVINAQDRNRSAASVQAKSEFNVDFGNKRITGQITPNDKRFNNIQLAGSVQGNRIIGDTVNGYRSMEGGFYGPKAEEIAGRYDVVEHGKEYINGTFGAKR